MWDSIRTESLRREHYQRNVYQTSPGFLFRQETSQSDHE